MLSSATFLSVKGDLEVLQKVASSVLSASSQLYLLTK